MIAIACTRAVELYYHKNWFIHFMHSFEMESSKNFHIFPEWPMQICWDSFQFDWSVFFRNDRNFSMLHRKYDKMATLMKRPPKKCNFHTHSMKWSGISIFVIYHNLLFHKSPLKHFNFYFWLLFSFDLNWEEMTFSINSIVLYSRNSEDSRVLLMVDTNFGYFSAYSNSSHTPRLMNVCHLTPKLIGWKITKLQRHLIRG